VSLSKSIFFVFSLQPEPLTFAFRLRRADSHGGCSTQAPTPEKIQRAPLLHFGHAPAEGSGFPYARGMDKLLARITIDPVICHGKPCVRGLRYPVEMLLELLSSGMTIDEILADYEDLEPDDLLAVLAFAAQLARTRRLQPVAP
jgi:uncharacterized protein (DUF433 family)